MYSEEINRNNSDDDDDDNEYGYLLSSLQEQVLFYQPMGMKCKNYAFHK